MLLSILERALSGVVWLIVTAAVILVDPVIGFVLGITLISKYCIGLYRDYQAHKMVKELLESIEKIEKEESEGRKRYDQ